jgi:hypothetical protein
LIRTNLLAAPPLEKVSDQKLYGEFDPGSG